MRGAPPPAYHRARSLEPLDEVGRELLGRRHRRRRDRAAGLPVSRKLLEEVEVRRGELGRELMAVFHAELRAERPDDGDEFSEREGLDLRRRPRVRRRGLEVGRAVIFGPVLSGPGGEPGADDDQLLRRARKDAALHRAHRLPAAHVVKRLGRARPARSSAEADEPLALEGHSRVRLGKAKRMYATMSACSCVVRFHAGLPVPIAVRKKIPVW